MKALAGGGLKDVVEFFALIERIQKRGEAAEVEGGGADAEQVIADPRQLGEKSAQVFAARRQFDAEEFLDRVVPGDFVGGRRDVIHAIDDRDVLVEVEIFAEFLETAVEKADVRHRLDHGFAVEREDEAQRRVRGGMLGTEIQRPEEFFLLFREAAGLDQFEWHGFLATLHHSAAGRGVRLASTGGVPVPTHGCTHTQLSARVMTGKLCRSPLPRSG